MVWFKKKKSSNFQETQSNTKDIEVTLDALRRGMISLASDYYFVLADRVPEEKYKLLHIYTAVTGESKEGFSIIDATKTLNKKQLQKLQTMIENDWKPSKN